MRHRKSGKKLGRTWEHRKAMFRNMTRSLVVHERIRTTQTKARELSKIADKLITLALKDDVSSRRQAFKMLGNHSLVQKLFNEIGPKFNGGSGGYTRVVKYATPRVGDAAPMAVIEFAFPETQSATKHKTETAAPTAAVPDKAETAAVTDETDASNPEQAETAAETQEPEAQALEQEESQPENVTDAVQSQGEQDLSEPDSSEEKSR